MIAQIFDIIAPVFLLIAAGAAATKLGWMSEAAIDGLMSFALKFAAPSLLFLSVARLDLSDNFSWPLMLAFYLPATLSFFLGIILTRVFFNRRPGEAVSSAFGALFSNALLLGLPIAQRAYGSESLSTNIALIAVHAPFCYLLGISCMEILRRDKQSIGHSVLVISTAIFRNPLMIGIALGFSVNFSGVTLSSPVLSAVEMISLTTLPVALFAIGGVLTRYALADSLAESLTITALKLIFFPAMVYLMATQVFMLETRVMRNAVLMAAMAPGVNAFVFATMYNRSKGVAASAILLATSASVFTASAWIWFLGT